MKESLLAPFNMRAPIAPISSQVNKRDMDNKFKDIMGFGTPNIRPWKRMKHMDQSQIKSHLNLQRMVGTMGGNSVSEAKPDSQRYYWVTSIILNSCQIFHFL